ncbi:sugar transport protein 2-like [Mercurialis annua]|uniref:sugar transport protein 2-like n=1 Tax=Mercurialis annua TaxID=3986 RepID=UPI0021605770|nr:sugar transport protein 2-like [Mercurialis annua]
MAASISMLFAFSLKNIWESQLFVLMALGIVLTVVIPTIITEMELDRMSGLNIELGRSMAVGTTLAIGLNYSASYFHVWGWRFSTGFIIQVAFLLLMIYFYIFETPSWLLEYRKISESKVVLGMVLNAIHVDHMCAEIDENILRTKVVSHLQVILHHESRPALVIMPWIFWRFGRRRPLIIASILMLSSLAYVSVIFYLYVDSHFLLQSSIVYVIMGLTKSEHKKLKNEGEEKGLSDQICDHHSFFFRTRNCMIFVALD